MEDKHIKPLFPVWCQKILPLVYDESLSYYENLCRFSAKLCEIIKSQNNLQDEFYRLKEWIDTQLKNYSEEQLQEWLDNGTLENIINNEIFNKLNSKIDNIYSIIVDVKQEGAKGDGVTDDTEVLNTIINKYNGSGAYIYFPKGTYIINGEILNNIESVKDPNNEGLCLNNIHDLSFVFNKDSKLQLKSTNAENYVILNIRNSWNISFNNLTINGLVYEMTGTTNEWGYGIHISNSNNINFENLKVTNVNGDFIYIGSNYYNGNISTYNNNINIYNAKLDNAHRNGISICSGDNINLSNININNVKYNNPKSGIDIELEGWYSNSNYLGNIEINNIVTTNVGYGISFNDRDNTANVIINNSNGGIFNIVKLSNGCFDNIKNSISLSQGFIIVSNSKVNTLENANGRCKVYNTSITYLTNNSSLEAEHCTLTNTITGISSNTNFHNCTFYPTYVTDLKGKLYFDSNYIYNDNCTGNHIFNYNNPNNQLIFTNNFVRFNSNAYLFYGGGDTQIIANNVFSFGGVSMTNIISLSFHSLIAIGNIINIINAANITNFINTDKGSFASNSLIVDRNIATYPSKNLNFTAGTVSNIEGATNLRKG